MSSGPKVFFSSPLPSLINSKPSFAESSLINSGARLGRRPFGELVGSVSNKGLFGNCYANN